MKEELNTLQKSAKIRKLLHDISELIEKENRHSIYEILTSIVINMESRYNLQDDEIITQLELILKAETKGGQ